LFISICSFVFSSISSTITCCLGMTIWA